MSEEYDLKKSEKGIGQLYPVLKDKNGNVIDGFHRLDDDPNWRTETLEHIDSEEKLLVARAVSNWNRRKVSKEEKEEWINGLAEIFREQGYKILDKFPFTNEIKKKIAEVTGLHEDTVTNYLRAEFKQTITKSPTQEPKISASERIERTLGEDYVERHRKQVLAEEKLSPEEKAKLEAERQQRREEKKRKDEENKQKRKEQTRLKAIESALSKIEKAKKLGFDVDAFEARCKQIKIRIVDEPDVAYKETKSLKKDLDTAINKEKKRRDEEKRKQCDEEIRRQAEEEARLKLLHDKDFLREVAALPVEEEPNTTEIQKPEQIVAEMIKEIQPAFEKAFENIKPYNQSDPERNKLVLNMLLKNLQAGLLFCPVCNKKMFECSFCHTTLGHMRENHQL